MCFHMEACIINEIVFVNGFGGKWQYSVSEDGGVYGVDTAAPPERKEC